MSTSNKPRKNRVIVSVLGQDRVGIIAAVAQILSTHNINILDISQTIMQKLFTMILIADMENSDIDLATLKELLHDKGKELGLKLMYSMKIFSASCIGFKRGVAMLTMQEILETIKMVQEEHLDIRTITMGISIRDCAHEN